jgi:hypothetical protein
MRFNPPPNWPTPSPGWEPGPDWSPDPSWPPAPPGWQFWMSGSLDEPKQPPAMSKPTQTQQAVGATLPVLDAMGSAKRRLTTFIRLRETGDTGSSPGGAKTRGLVARVRLGAAPVRDRLVRIVNPIRAASAAAAVCGLLVLVWNFAAIRFDEQWNYAGWGWRGVLPVLAMLAGAIVAAVGGIAVRHWDFQRWTRWHRSRTAHGR